MKDFLLLAFYSVIKYIKTYIKPIIYRLILESHYHDKIKAINNIIFKPNQYLQAV